MAKKNADPIDEDAPEIPGTVEVSEKDAQLERLARAYRKLMLNRKEVLALEVEAKKEVLDYMEEHEITSYQRADISISTESVEKLKVTVDEDE
jgi:hypothetical protein